MNSALLRVLSFVVKHLIFKFFGDYEEIIFNKHADFLIISGMVVINKRIDDYFTKLLYGDKTEVSLLLKDDADCLALINSLKKISEGETSVSQYFLPVKMS